MQEHTQMPTPACSTPTPYLMSSNSPSGGMKLMLLSESNLLSLTHWWKVQSSMAIDCLPLKHKAELNKCSKFNKCKLQPVVQSLLRQKLFYRARCQCRCPGNGEAGRDSGDSGLLAQTSLASPLPRLYFKTFV